MDLHLSPIVDRLAKVPAIVGLLVAMMATGYVLLKLRTEDPRPLDGQRFYPLSKIATLDDFKGDERWIYAVKELTLDLAYPILYSLFGAALLTWLLGGVATSHPWLYALRWLPILMAACDVVENLGFTTLLVFQGKKLAGVPVVTWLASAGKWAFLYASLAAMAVGVVVRLVAGGRAS